MNRSIVLVFVLAASFLASCGDDDDQKQSYAVDTPTGKVKFEGVGKDGMTIETPEGKVTYSADGATFKGEARDKDGKTQAFELSSKVDPAAFENMVYPGATPLDETAMSSVKTNEAETVTGVFVTADAPDKIVTHYKSVLPNAKPMAIGPQTYISGTTASGATVTITIIKDEDSAKTKVLVNVVKNR
jgi:hypothetical protein